MNALCQQCPLVIALRAEEAHWRRRASTFRSVLASECNWRAHRAMMECRALMSRLRVARREQLELGGMEEA